MTEHRGRSWSATMLAFFLRLPPRTAASVRAACSARRWAVLSGVLSLTLGLAACSNSGGPTLGPLEVPDRVNATVVVGEATYTFVAQCFDDGQLFEARGATIDPATALPVGLLVRLTAREGYVGLVFGDDEYVIEPSLAESLVLVRNGDSVRGEEIAFVRDLDFRTRDASPVGRGSLQLDCASVTQGTAPPA